MSLCRNCGRPLAEGWRFCGTCGAEVAEVAEAKDTAPDRPKRSRLPLLLVGALVAATLAGGTLAVVFLRPHRTGGTPLSAASSSHPRSRVTPTTSPAATFAQLFAKESSGVIRIEATSCGGEDIGTGFLIAPRLVATVAHVVESPVTVALTASGQTTTGTILGVDPSHDLALVRADHALSGHVFAFATSPPQVGDPVAAMGFPEGLPITFTQGAVSGLDRDLDVNGRKLTRLVQTDTALNPGNSGGPLINAKGEVAGLVDAKLANAEGISYAIAAASAASILEAWQQHAPLAPASCATPVGPPGGGTLPAPGNPDAAGIAATLSRFFNAINQAHYGTAWEQFTPAQRQRVSEAHLANDDATSFVFDAELRGLTRLGPTTIVAYVTFTSIQAPEYGPNGETCDRWTLDYTMKLIGSGWLIDGSGPHHGSTHSTC